VFADLHQRRADVDAWNDQPGQPAGGHPGRSFARRGAPAAAVVAHAIFDVIGEIGMAGPIALGDVGVILRALVGVLDQHRNRCSGCHQRAVILVHDA
jgi:hypothetical protein